MSFLEEILNSDNMYKEDTTFDITSKIMQIRKESIKQSLLDLDAIGHRQEYVATIDGIMYYDDSGAESVNATWFTFENLVAPVVWIAGGNDKKTDYEELLPKAIDRVKAIVCIGDSKRLHQAFGNTNIEIFDADDMQEAVKMASIIVHDNEIVLLSPACKPNRRFTDFADRGNQFKNYVYSLQNERYQ